MAIDQLYAVNQALAHLGQEPTTTLDTDLPACSAATRKALAHADAARDAVLEGHPWLDALVYATLTAAATSGTGGIAANWRWPYHFVLPTGGLRVFMVGDPGDCEPTWERGVVADLQGVEKAVIRCTDPGPLDVAYTTRIDWSSMSQILGDAVALEIAARACHAVTGDLALALRLRQAAAMAFDRAQGWEAPQQGGQEPPLPSVLASVRASAF